MAFSSPTDAYTNTDMAAVIMEEWTPIVNEPNFPKAVLANFFTDLTPYAQAGVDILHVPDIFTNVFSVQTQSTQGAAVVDASVATVDTTLTVNTHKYVAWIIGDLTLRQMAQFYSLNEKYAREAKNLLTQALEDSLAALWSSLTTNTVGDTATVVTDYEIRQAIKLLDALNYDLTQTAFFFHPHVFWMQLGGISKYYQNDIALSAFIRNGTFGPMDRSRGMRGVLYDQPVYVTTRIVQALLTFRNLFAHPSAFGFAIQGAASSLGGLSAPDSGAFAQSMGGPSRVRVQAQYVLMNLGLLSVVDIIYGVAVLREPAAVLVNASDTAGVS